MLIVLVVVAFIASTGGVKGGIASYRYFNVLSSSMQSQYPKGSALLVREVAIDTLSKGDDITFYADKHTIITHRIEEIITNYDGGEDTAFITKGVNNPMVDADPVFAPNVIGKVVLNMPYLGFVLSFIAQNIPLIAIAAVALIVFGVALKNIFKREKTGLSSVTDQLSSEHELYFGDLPPASRSAHGGELRR